MRPNYQSGPVGGAIPSQGGATPGPGLGRYCLTREADTARGRRLQIAGGGALAGMLCLLIAWHDLTSGQPTILLDVGLGRLATLAAQHGWSGAWLISALELAHVGLLALVFAVTLWFGAAQRPPVLPGEELIFFRRQSPWIAANPAAIAGAGFLIGVWLSAAGLPLLAVPVEMVALSLLAAALWQVMVPEARIAMAVVLDGNMGWGNRIILSGGLFRLGSRLTIRKDWFLTARARDIGALEMLGNARGIDLAYLDTEGTQQRLRIRGVSHDPEAGVLASILNTVFTLALTHASLRDTIRLNRLPPGIQP